jgi:hypothetical protein
MTIRRFRGGQNGGSGIIERYLAGCFVDPADCHAAGPTGAGGMFLTEPSRTVYVG